MKIISYFDKNKNLKAILLIIIPLLILIIFSSTLVIVSNKEYLFNNQTYTPGKIVDINQINQTRYECITGKKECNPRYREIYPPQTFREKMIYEFLIITFTVFGLTIITFKIRGILKRKS